MKSASKKKMFDMQLNVTANWRDAPDSLRELQHTNSHRPKNTKKICFYPGNAGVRKSGLNVLN